MCLFQQFCCDSSFQFWTGTRGGKTEVGGCGTCQVPGIEICFKSKKNLLVKKKFFLFKHWNLISLHSLYSIFHQFTATLLRGSWRTERWLTTIPLLSFALANMRLAVINWFAGTKIVSLIKTKAWLIPRWLRALTSWCSPCTRMNLQ